jgi:hypothetical protein
MEPSQNITLKFSEIESFLPVIDPRVIVALIGPPGTGKSACVESAAKKVEMAAKKAGKAAPVFMRRDCCTMRPEDFGVPFLIDGFTQFIPPRFLGLLGKGAGKDGVDPEGFGCFEDLSNGPPAVQKALAQLLSVGEIGDFKLSPRVRVVITGNRAQDKSGARALFAHIRNRVQVIELLPDLEEWMTWAFTAGLPGVIGAFLQLRPQHFSQLPSQACKINGGFATPREWEKVGLTLLSLEGMSEMILHANVAGAVGLGVGAEFMAFRRLQKDMPDPKKVLEDPEGAMPTPPSKMDRLTAVSTAIGEYAARHQSKKVYLQLLLALAHIAGKTREAVAAGLTVFQANGGNVAKLFDAAAANKNDPRVLALIQHFAASVS